MCEKDKTYICTLWAEKAIELGFVHALDYFNIHILHIVCKKKRIESEAATLNKLHSYNNNINIDIWSHTRIYEWHVFMNHRRRFSGSRCGTKFAIYEYKKQQYNVQSRMASETVAATERVEGMRGNSCMQLNKIESHSTCPKNPFVLTCVYIYKAHLGCGSRKYVCLFFFQRTNDISTNNDKCI